MAAVKFDKALKIAKKLAAAQIEEFAKEIEKGWDHAEENQQFEVKQTLKFKAQDGGDIKVKTDISFVTDKIKDTAEEIVTNQTKLPGV